MKIEASASFGRIGALSAAMLCSTLLLVGCGSSGSANTTQNTTPTAAAPAPSQPAPPPSGGTSGMSGGTTGGTSTPGGTSSGGSGSGTSSGGSNSGAGGTDNSTAITGTIVDAQTNAPINGSVVVALEQQTPSDYTIVTTSTADENGHFRFDNVSPAQNNYALMVSAKSSNGTLFAPTLLISGNSAFISRGEQITVGSDVGTITVQPSPSGTITGTVSSSNAANAGQEVNVVFNQLATFNMDREFRIAWPGTSPQVTTHQADPQCGNQSGACSQFTLTVPTAHVWWAVFDHNGNSFTSSGENEIYSLDVSALSTTTSQPVCEPSNQFVHAGTMTQGGQVSGVNLHFQNCTP